MLEFFNNRQSNYVVDKVTNRFMNPDSPTKSDMPSSGFTEFVYKLGETDLILETSSGKKRKQNFHS